MRGSAEQVMRANRLQRARHEAAVAIAMEKLNRRVPLIQVTATARGLTTEHGPTPVRDPWIISQDPESREDRRLPSGYLLTSNRVEGVATNTGTDAGIMARASNRERGDVGGSERGASGQVGNPSRERPPRPSPPKAIQSRVSQSRESQSRESQPRESRSRESQPRGSPQDPSQLRDSHLTESLVKKNQASRVTAGRVPISQSQPELSPEGGRHQKEDQQEQSQQKGGQKSQQGESSQRVSPERESQPKEGLLRRSPTSQSQPSLSPVREGGLRGSQHDREHQDRGQQIGGQGSQQGFNLRTPILRTQSRSSLSPLLERSQPGESTQGGSQSRGGQQGDSRQGTRSQGNSPLRFLATLTGGLANIHLGLGRRGSDRRHRGSGRADGTARSSSGLRSGVSARSSASARPIPRPMLVGPTGANDRVNDPVGAAIPTEYEGSASRRGSHAPVARVANLPARGRATSRSGGFST
jgi:hypothetical protein